jgi:hypothetical protein
VAYIVTNSGRGRQRLGQADSLFSYQNQDPSVGPVTSGNAQAVAASQAIAAEATAAGGTSAGAPYDQSEYIAEQQYQLDQAQQQAEQPVSNEWIYWIAAAVIAGIVLTR